MNVLIVYAHPGPRSLNGSLKDFAVDHLQSKCDEVHVSDLYQTGWRAVIDSDDQHGLERGRLLAPDVCAHPYLAACRGTPAA
ncbi:flavodoxin family protein, partial [Pseudomonas syringae]